ncbi:MULTISPECIES: hypothetical protein [unclassified Mesorhizobium]|uniref:hypothetical protein n=1 Tax=unclassified Mesorhizobium TaxID=325217 RepID=UPI001FDF0A92|nr:MULTISPECIES: hypothetical protein [unclassified Mesorhizobium]
MAGSSNETTLVRAGDDAVGSQDMFNKELQTYRKIVGANLMFHREVYGVLRDLLVEHAPASFRFLDIACGDASASAAMLKTMAMEITSASTCLRHLCDWRHESSTVCHVRSSCSAMISPRPWRSGLSLSM